MIVFAMGVVDDRTKGAKADAHPRTGQNLLTHWPQQILPHTLFGDKSKEFRSNFLEVLLNDSQ
jgi:hypothetical protein